jgi:AcrR family transcriptional regulator
MPRPRSDDKHGAILSAAARIIATQGLGATTAAIAKEAGVSNGSLFTYFDTKTELLNQLYLNLKTDMGTTVLAGLPADDAREQLRHMWTRWLQWASADPSKRRALAQLQVSDEITPDTHRAASESMAGIAATLERSRAHGPMRDAPLPFVVTLFNAVAEATIDFTLRDPDHAQEHGRAGFEALWRMLT